jgi:hypothetical protein
MDTVFEQLQQVVKETERMTDRLVAVVKQIKEKRKETRNEEQ